MIELIKSELGLIAVVFLVASFAGALIAGKLCPLTVKVKGKITAFIWELKIILIIDILAIIVFIGLQVAGVVKL
jgi:hypothetical protein